MQTERYLKRQCPICEQRSALAPIACPKCRHLALRCCEEGATFLDPKQITIDTAVWSADAPRCPKCGETGLDEFVDAAEDDITKTGVSLADFD